MTTPIRPQLPAISPIERGQGMPIGGSGDAGGANFGDLLTRAIGNVQGMQDRNADAIGDFVAGKPVSLNEVVAASEEASLSLQLLVETRNKLTDAYRSIMNMQV